MYKWYLGSSNIHGFGIFANQSIQPNEIIDTAIDDTNGTTKITYFGSKINHAWAPLNNTKLIHDEKNKVYVIVAKRFIPHGTEITLDYRGTPNFIKKPNPEWN